MPFGKREGVGMAKFSFAVGLLVAMLPAYAADHAVRGHVKKDGTYVAPSHATNPNHSYSNGEGVPKNVA